MFEVGTGKTDITVDKKGVGMMGYGMFRNIVLGVETPIYARAVVFRDSNTGKKLAYVNAEICFITIAIKNGVVKRFARHHEELGYTEQNLFLTAQHTHSAPGGYSNYGLYNMSIPGFVPEVYTKVVDGIVEAILQAEKNLQSAELKIATGTFDAGLEVAFNRSVHAYNLNPEVKVKRTEKDKHLAVDREMTLLRIDTPEGKPIASVNWFGVHTTSLSNDNHLICSDNKGYAAHYHEEEMRHHGKENFISIFAQHVSGDVTPNFIWDKKKNWMRGKFENDFDSAKFNGNLQYEKAKEIFEKAKTAKVLLPEIDFVKMNFDFRNITCDPEFANGKTNARTGPSCHGVAFFAGTLEGPGMPKPVTVAATVLSRLIKVWEKATLRFMNDERRKSVTEKYIIQGKKDILVETGERRMLGTPNVKNLFIPGWADKSIGTFKEYHRNGSLDNKPWIPQVLPFHIAIIGNLALVGIPCEITTIAGQRLRNTVAEVLKQRGVERVLISSYTNAYCGYVTTYEEYQMQCYEGGHTVYGEYTLAAFQTKFKFLAEQLLKKPEERNLEEKAEPAQFTEEEIAKRTYKHETQKRLIKMAEAGKI
ncbi:MAG: Neutral ceramidase [Bacteroidia bacterium]|nr:Neutral ceramidase [Bacteroidia bacterium]